MSKRATTRQANAEFKAMMDDLFKPAVGYKTTSDVSKAAFEDLLKRYNELKRQLGELSSQCMKANAELWWRLKPAADAVRELGITGMYVSVQPDGKIRIDVRYDGKEYATYFK